MPLVKWARLQTELPTYEEVKEWFTPNNRSVGVAMGPVSGLFLLDFDFTKHNEAREFFDTNAHRLPRTWKEKTKSGGLHLYFRWSAALDARRTNTTGTLCAGVDTKGKGGYSKMSPSAGYEWINPPHLTPLAALPDWILQALPKAVESTVASPTTTGATSWVANELANLRPGVYNWNSTFTKVAGSLRARGYEAADIFELLRGRASELGFPLADLSAVCQSVGRYATAQVERAATNVESFLSDIETVEWLVPGIVSRRSIGFVAGLPETMKTWLLIDLAIECARGGGQWLGKYPCEGARVLFIDQERFKGETQRRFKALLSQKGLKVRDLRDNLFVRCGTTTRIDLPVSYDAFRKELTDIRPDLVIVDSFATFHTSEENNRGEIQAVLERLKALRNEFGCTFAFIDHENKGAFHAKAEGEEPTAFRMAGSIAKPAAAEFVLTVRRHDPDTSMVYHTKSTLASTAAPFMVRVRDVAPEKIVVEAL